MNILPGNLRFGAGQPVKRLEDQRLLTGKGAFIDDRPADDTLWLYVLRSPHAHAKIKSIDTKAAAEMPGVEAIYTGADLIKDDIGTIPTLSIFKRPDGKPMTVPPRRPKPPSPTPRIKFRSIWSASGSFRPRWSRARPLPRSTRPGACSFTCNRRPRARPATCWRRRS